MSCHFCQKRNRPCLRFRMFSSKTFKIADLTRNLIYRKKVDKFSIAINNNMNKTQRKFHPASAEKKLFRKRKKNSHEGAILRNQMKFLFLSPSIRRFPFLAFINFVCTKLAQQLLIKSKTIEHHFVLNLQLIQLWLMNFCDLWLYNKFVSLRNTSLTVMTFFQVSCSESPDLLLL